MRRIIARFVLPALLFSVGIWFLLNATGPRPFLSYLMSALFLGMGIAALQNAWGSRGR